MACYHTDDLNTYYELTPSSATDSVIGAWVNGSGAPIIGTAVTSISIYIYADSGLSAGEFALGVWDSSGDLKNESDTFTVDDLPSGTSPALPTQTYTASITSTTIANGDSIGIITKTAPTGTGQVPLGGYDAGGTIPYWKRSYFVEGNTPVEAASRMLVFCINETPPPPSSSGTLLPPPYANIGLHGL